MKINMVTTRKGPFCKVDCDRWNSV